MDVVDAPLGYHSDDKADFENRHGTSVLEPKRVEQGLAQADEDYLISFLFRLWASRLDMSHDERWDSEMTWQHWDVFSPLQTTPDLKDGY